MEVDTIGSSFDFEFEAEEDSGGGGMMCGGGGSGGLAARMEAFQRLREQHQGEGGDAPAASSAVKLDKLEESIASPHTRPRILSPKKSLNSNSGGEQPLLPNKVSATRFLLPSPPPSPTPQQQPSSSSSHPGTSTHKKLRPSPFTVALGMIVNANVDVDTKDKKQQESNKATNDNDKNNANDVVVAQGGSNQGMAKGDKDKDDKDEKEEEGGEEDDEDKENDANIKFVRTILGPAPTTLAAITERYTKLAAIIRDAKTNKRLQFIPPKFPTTSIKEVLGADAPDDVTHRLRLAAKQRVWERMSLDLLTQEEMMTFYGVLEKYAETVPIGLNRTWFQLVEKNLRKRGLLSFEKYMDVPSFLRAKLEMDPRISNWLQMRHFMIFMRESDDIYFRRVPILHLFNYVMKKVWLKQTRLGFMNYDQHGEGYLTEEWLESYIRELLPTLVQLEGIDPALEAFYLCGATRKFFFFLDPKRIGKIRIVDILASMLLDEILELRDPEVKESNWFSKQCMLRVYQHYIYLDRDANGMLSCEEFMRFNFSTNGVSVRLTRAFVEQLFSEKMTFRGEMDFRSFVDFVLAMENRKEEAAIAYFMRVLDLNKKGFLNAFDLHYFYKDVYKVLSVFNPETPRFNDVKDEIFDMVRPADPLKITVKDLHKCGKGDLVLGMLIDAKGFDEYENREFVVPSNQISSPPHSSAYSSSQ